MKADVARVARALAPLLLHEDIEVYMEAADAMEALGEDAAYVLLPRIPSHPETYGAMVTELARYSTDAALIRELWAALAPYPRALCTCQELWSYMGEPDA